MASQTNKKNNTVDANIYIEFNPGTTSSHISDIQQAIIVKNGDSIVHRKAVAKIYFDFKIHHNDNFPGLSELIGDLDGRDGDDFFIRAILPTDGPSLEKAEAEGKLRFMPKNWRRQPGTSQDNMGSGGKPRKGATLATLNEEILENSFIKAFNNCTSHEKRQELVLDGMDSNSNPTRIPVSCECSAPTGTANGTTLSFVPKIKGIASSLNLHIKVVLNLILCGSLPVDNKQRARINESNFLKHIMAFATGQVVDPISGKICEPFIDQVFIFTDTNPWGRIKSFDRLLVQQAYCGYLLWSSPLSPDIHERNIDNEEWDFDKDTGEPKLGSTISCSCITFESSKVLAYSTYLAESILADTFSQKQQEAKANEQALSLGQMYEIIESDEDSTVTSRILGRSDSKGQSITIQLRSRFADQTAGVGGLDGAGTKAEVVNNMANNDLATVYGPIMIEEAERIFDEIVVELKKFVNDTLKGKTDLNKNQTGWFDVISVLNVFRKLLDGSRQSIAKKIGQIQEISRPHEEIVNDVCEELDRISNLSALRKKLSFFRIRRISACLQTSGLAYLEYRLQASACRIAVQQLLDKLIDFVDDKLAELSLLMQNLQQVHASSKQLADYEVTKPTLRTMMLGLDLVTEEYLSGFFNYVAAKHDGIENLICDLTARYLSEYNSLAFLAGKHPDQIEQILGQVCKDVFEPWLNQRNVMTELQRCYPNEGKQRQLFQQLLQQSEGRVRTRGENGQNTVWTKFVTTPNADEAEKIKAIVEKLDDKPGQWNTIVDGNNDVITVIQIRTNISLQSLIDGLELPDNPDTWEEMIELAVNPFTVMIEPPNPNDRQLRRVFAKAIVTGQLIYDDVNGFELRFSDEESVSLGKGIKDARWAIRRQWSHIVRIGTTFGHHMVIDDKDVAKRIEQLKSLPSEDLRFSLIDDKAIYEVKEQFDLLIERAERLRTAVKED